MSMNSGVVTIMEKLVRDYETLSEIMTVGEVHGQVCVKAAGGHMTSIYNIIGVSCIYTTSSCLHSLIIIINNQNTTALN